MPSLTSERAAPVAATATVSCASFAPRRAIAKLSFCPIADARIVAALGAYPDRRHSTVLASWLRAGWRLATGRAVVAPVIATVPDAEPPSQGLIRRIFVDARAEPGLDDFLRGLPRHERGREIRHFVEVALARARVPTPSEGGH